MANVGPKSVSLLSVAMRPRAPLRSAEEGNGVRPKSAPSSPNAGRKLLASRSGKTSAQKRLHYVSAKRQQAARQAAKQRQATIVSSSDARQRHNSVNMVVRPGYTLCRSPTRVLMNINTAAFFGERTQEDHSSRPQSRHSVRVVSPSSSAAASQRVMEESIHQQQVLQREIAELNMRLENQGEEHEEFVQELQEEFDKEKKRLAHFHEMDKSELCEGHKRQMQLLQDNHLDELQDMKLEMSSEASRLHGELDFTKELLESTRKELMAEAEERLQAMEEDLSEQHAHEQALLESTLRAEGEAQLAELRAEMERGNKRKTEALQNQHKQEMNALLSQFTDAAKLEEELAQMEKHAKKLEGEVSKLKEALDSAHSQQLDTETILLETKKKLQEFERDFKEKVYKVDERYREHIDGLMHENTELRRRLIRKTEQHSSYKTQVEKSQTRVLRDFSERVRVVVQARNRANLGVALGLGESQLSEIDQCDQGRPLSAPTTVQESSHARVKATSPPPLPSRPHSCFTHLENRRQ